jgi:hypothetical protein
MNSKCAKRLPVRYSSYGRPCKLAGVVEQDGNWWCRLHAPDAVATREAARDAAWRAKWKAKRDAEARSLAIRRLRDNVVMEAVRMVDAGYAPDHTGDKLSRAVHALLRLQPEAGS